MENLRTIREKRNMTQVNLSVKLGIAQETVSGYEIGKSYPSADILIKMADILRTSTDYLLDRTNIDAPINLIKSELTDVELDIINSYRNLSTDNQHKLLGYIEALKK